jgi:polysaccharide biosynthesis transport protein
MSNWQRSDKLSSSATQLDAIRTQPVITRGKFVAGHDRYAAESQGSIMLDLWKTVKRHRRLVILLTALGFLASLLFTLCQVPSYRAFALLQLQGLNEDFLDIKSVNPNASAGQYPIESTVQTQIKIVQSEPVMIRSLDRMKLYTKERTSKTQTVFGEMLSSMGWVHPTPKPTTDVVQDATDTVHVRAIGPTSIIEVTANSPDPFVAALYVNTIADEFIAQTAAARSISSEKTSTWLRSQLQDLRARLEQAENNLEAYANQSNLMFPQSSDSTTGLSVEQQRLEQLQEELSKAEADRVSKQSSYEQSQSRNPDALPPVLDNGPIRDYQLKLADLRRQEAELTATLNPLHPKVVRVEQAIAQLQATMARERSNVIARLRHEFETAQRRENLLNAAYQAQSRTVGSQEAKRVRYGTLKSEVDSDRQLFEAMLRKVKESDFAKALQATSVRIVNPALIPQKPVTPKIPLNLFFGSILGLVAGVGLALFKEGAENPIRSPGQSAGQLQTRELGVIPKLMSSQLSAVDGPVMRSIASSGEHSPALGLNGQPAAALSKSKPSFVSESFRSVLQSILIAAQHGTPTRLITITSPEPGDGKTTMASNLAIAVSELRKKVLVIDCDMRRPGLHKMFGMEREPGLSDLLRSENPLDPQRLDQVVRKTSYPGLSLIPSGNFPDNISYLLNSERLQQIFAFFRERFDMIIVDSPPMMHSPDARILGKNSDGVIMVLRAGKTSFSSAYAVRECLNHDAIPLLGTVLNDWNAHEHKSYKAYRDYYS